MNEEDNRDTTESVAEEESSGEAAIPVDYKEMRLRFERRMADILIIGSIIGFIIFVYVWVARPFDAKHSGHFEYCLEALYKIDDGIAHYEEDNGNGVYPASIEELKPYMWYSLEDNDVCIYSLDTSTTPPVARCSIHGTLDTFCEDLEKGEQLRHRIKFVIITTIFILCEILGIYLGIRNNRKRYG